MDSTFIMNESLCTPSCPYCHRYVHAGHRDTCPVTLAIREAVAAERERIADILLKRAEIWRRDPAGAEALAFAKECDTIADLLKTGNALNARKP